MDVLEVFFGLRTGIVVLITNKEIKIQICINIFVHIAHASISRLSQRAKSAFMRSVLFELNKLFTLTCDKSTTLLHSMHLTYFWNSSQMGISSASKRLSAKFILALSSCMEGSIEQLKWRYKLLEFLWWHLVCMCKFVNHSISIHNEILLSRSQVHTIVSLKAKIWKSLVK